LKKKIDFNPSFDFYALSLFSVLMFLLVLTAFYRQANPEWKRYQQDFKKLLEEEISPEAAAAFDFSVEQIWLPEINRVDRCISCHLGYDNPLLAAVNEPFRTHPDIAPHSVLKMGCTLCHGGQGFSLKKKDAHGETEHWEEPLLGRKMGERYGFKKNELIQINCNVCHRNDEATAGMELINSAKDLLTSKKKCETCHKINGVGGYRGPNLTFVGDKPAERFDFSEIKVKLSESGRPLSLLSWHFEHLMNPKAVVPDSKMPQVNYSEEEAWSLAMLMMSWKNIVLPIALIPGGTKKDLGIIESSEIPDEGELSFIDWGEKLFNSESCADCHSIGGGADDAPDLKGVTKRRGLKWLRSMIINPEEMEQNDPIAIKLYEEFDELGMVSDDLTDEEVEAIIKYLDSFE
jgi:cytochrome c2